MKKILIKFFALPAYFLFLFISYALADEKASIVFYGAPSVQIIEGGFDRVAGPIEPSKMDSAECIIQEIDGKYYWATRNRKPLLRVAAGAYITYISLDGAGYIRIIDPSLKPVGSQISKTDVMFDYVEHMTLGLRSVTYYGRAIGSSKDN